MPRVNCYKCKHFEPETDPKVRNRPPYIVGYCHLHERLGILSDRVMLLDHTIKWISKRGCDGFELRGDLGIRHWDQWDKKESDNA